MQNFVLKPYSSLQLLTRRVKALSNPKRQQLIQVQYPPEWRLRSRPPWSNSTLHIQIIQNLIKALTWRKHCPPSCQKSIFAQLHSTLWACLENSLPHRRTTTYCLKSDTPPFWYCRLWCRSSPYEREHHHPLNNFQMSSLLLGKNMSPCVQGWGSRTSEWALIK